MRASSRVTGVSVSLGDDDADGEQTVGEVVEAGVGAGLFGVAGLGGDGDAVDGLVHVVGFGGLRRGWACAPFRRGKRKLKEERERWIF